MSAQIMSEVAAMKKRDAACRCAGPWQKLGKSWTVPYSTPYLMVHHRFFLMSMLILRYPPLSDR